MHIAKAKNRRRFKLSSAMLAPAIFVLIALIGAFPASAAPPPTLGDPCDPNEGKSTILGVPTWYKYLGGEWTASPTKNSSGELVFDPSDSSKYSLVCQPRIEKIEDLLPISAAILDILVRIAGLAAFGYLIYGGFMYLTSSGESEKSKKAGSTLLNAAIGLAIAISATSIINFVGNRLTK